jgi:glyoxylase-like metal-dependent hydrolase (beta-lactamase superfamily II)
VDDALTGSLSREGRITEAHRPSPLEVDQIAVDRSLKEGDQIPVDVGVSFTVLETPGHSDCSLSFHEPVGRVLFISDATGYYLPAYKYWWPNYFTGYEAYLDSMERLAKLEAEILCLSHNGVIQGTEDIRTYFEGAISATRKYHDRIIRRVQTGRSLREIAGELGQEVHDRTQLLPLDFFQKNCGLLVKQSMKHEGITTEN